MNKLVLLATVTVIGLSSTPAQPLDVSGVVHVQNLGDQPFQEGQWAGTKGQGLRLEGFTFDFSPPRPELGLQYMCHVQNGGDTPWMAGGKFCGTRGMALRLEGLAIRLTGPAAASYDAYYACHLQNYGDTGPMMNGDFCGTRGMGLRLESIIIWVIPRGSPPPQIGPRISSFTASPDNGFVAVGSQATLTWWVNGCNVGCIISLDGHEGLGNLVLNVPRLAASGSLQVTPHFNTWYTLRAVNAVGSDSQQKEVKLFGRGNPGMPYYFKMTNSASTITPCFTTMIFAADQDTAKRVAESTNGGYMATLIDVDHFLTACNTGQVILLRPDL